MNMYTQQKLAGALSRTALRQRSLLEKHQRIQATFGDNMSMARYPKLSPTQIKGHPMQSKNEVTIEILEDSPIEEASIDELLKEYNTYRENDAADSATTAKAYTIGGLKDLNSMIADAVIKVNEYVAEDQNPSTLSSAKNKMLAVLDPNNKWLSKWSNKASEETKKVDIQAKNVDEVIQGIKVTMTTKRDEVETAAYRAFADKERLTNSLDVYTLIKEKAEKYLETVEPDSKEEFTTKRLIGMIYGTLTTLDGSIKDIQTLVTNAAILIQDINNDLPTIEAKLQDRLGIKGFQQEVSDLLNMKNAVVEMVNTVDDVTTTSIQNTAIETMELLANTGVDTKRLELKSARDKTYHAKMDEAIKKVKKASDDQFKHVQRLALATKSSQNKSTVAFIENYADGYGATKG